MKPIERNEILPLGDYEAVRPHFRDRVIAAKKRRRVSVGEHVSVVFENRDTVLLQIQEMLRTERITTESAILHEIDTYNDLVPAAGELSLTLMVEIADRETRERALVELAGLEEMVGLEVGGEVMPAKGKFFGVLEGRTTAVHYFKVALSESARERLRSKDAGAAIVVDHPKYTKRAPLAPAILAEIAEDLAT